MTVGLTLLGLLEGEASYGYELKRSYDARFGRARPLAFGQVYATLARLARDGLVVVDGTESGEGPDRKRYAVTTNGRAALDEWLSHAEPAEPHLQTVLFAKVVIGLLSGRGAAGFLDRQRAAHLERMRELTALRRRGDLIESLLADHALFHLEADLRWIDLTGARLDALASEVSP